MANRAYLYSKNREEIEEWEMPEQDYYDSRWDIPLAWWFLFCEKDLRLIKTSYGNESWEELKLVAEKKSAISLFQTRRVILDNIVKLYLPISPIDEFLKTIDRWPGVYLILDAWEVLPEIDSSGIEHKIRLVKLFILWILLLLFCLMLLNNYAFILIFLLITKIV